MRKILGVVAMLACTPASSSEIDAFKSLSFDAANCFAYYTIFKNCAPLTATKGELALAQSFVDRSGDIAIAAGRIAGMTDGEVGERYLSAIKSLMAELGNECTGFSTLSEKFSRSCGALIRDPKPRGLELHQ